MTVIKTSQNYSFPLFIAVFLNMAIIPIIVDISPNPAEWDWLDRLEFIALVLAVAVPVVGFIVWLINYFFSKKPRLRISYIWADYEGDPFDMKVVRLCVQYRRGSLPVRLEGFNYYVLDNGNIAKVKGNFRSVLILENVALKQSCEYTDKVTSLRVFGTKILGIEVYSDNGKYFMSPYIRFIKSLWWIYHNRNKWWVYTITTIVIFTVAYLLTR